VLLAHAGNGIVVGHAQADAERIAQVRDLARAADGHLVVTRCPAVLKSSSFVWGSHGPGVALMRAVKDQLDPRRLFNPGRFVDGI
jgi:glycolate oxidase FAD binding subunit